MIERVIEASDKMLSGPGGKTADIKDTLADWLAQDLIVVSGDSWVISEAGKHKLCRLFAVKDFIDAMVKWDAEQPDKEILAGLVVLVPNPKRPGTAAWEVFNCYQPRLSKEELIEELEAQLNLPRATALKHIKWDETHGFIRFEE